METIRYIEKIRKFNRYYSNVLGKIDQEIYGQPFLLIEARIIAEIHYNPGGTATEVREKLGIDRGYMSRILQRFDNENIITKKQSVEDKRQYLLYLTGHGEQIFEEMAERANRELTNRTQHLSKKELFSLVASMEEIESIYSKEPISRSGVTIRSFQPGDSGYVAYLHGKFYDKDGYEFGQVFEYYVLKGLTGFIHNPEGGQLWVAEVNGKIAGSIAIVKFSDTKAQLRWFIMDDNYRGKGIGKKLMETALAFCKEQGYQQVFLWTITTLTAARYLYAKYNFKPAEQRPNQEWSDKEIIEEKWVLDLYPG